MYPKKSFVVCSKVPLNLTLNRHLQLLATSWKILAQIIKMVAAVQWVILKQWSRYELCVSAKHHQGSLMPCSCFIIIGIMLYF